MKLWVLLQPQQSLPTNPVPIFPFIFGPPCIATVLWAQLADIAELLGHITQACHHLSQHKLWLSAWREIPETRWSCNGTEPRWVICPGASRGHPVLLLYQWGTHGSVQSPRNTHCMGYGVTGCWGKQEEEWSIWGKEEPLGTGESFLSLQSVGF